MRLGLSMVRLGLVGAGAVGLVGCDTQQACNPNTEVCDDVQGGTLFTGSESIERIIVGCCAPEDDDPRCGAEGSWWYDLVLEGSVRTASVTIRQPQAFPAQEHDEVHSLVVAQRDPDGFWENRYRELSVIDDVECQRPAECADQVVPSATTAFPCVDDAVERWQWRINLYDRDGEELACATWGLNSTEWAPECSLVEPQ